MWEYVILDEGWAVNLEADLFQIVPEIDLKKLTAYARQKNVGLILWAGYHAFARDMEHVCRHYSEMGIKGFKIDFMDRDDQEMVDFHYRAAEIAAKYKLICINDILLSMVYKASPSDLRLVLIDPKVVEMRVYAPYHAGRQKLHGVIP